MRSAGSSTLQNNRQLKLNAICLADGKPPAGKETPLSIEGSVTNAKGQTITLSQVQKQRAALLLTPLGARPTPQTHKIVYVAFTGDDNAPSQPDATLGHHGWVVAFDVDDWREAAAWLPTPSSFGGGIWQSSQGLAADDESNVYGVTSNGGYLVNPDPASTRTSTARRTSPKASSGSFAGEFAEARGLVLAVPDFGAEVLDVGGGRAIWPWLGLYGPGCRRRRSGAAAGDGVGARRRQRRGALRAGPGELRKDHRCDHGRCDFSKLKAPPAFLTFDASAPPYNGASAEGDLDFKPQPGLKTHHLHGTPVYWVSAEHGPMLFAWGENSELRAFSIDSSGRIKLIAHGAELASGQQLATDKSNMGGMPGGMVTVSADGQNGGIVWGTAPAEGDANMDPVPGVVRAYDATAFDPAPNPIGAREAAAPMAAGRLHLQ